MKYAREVIDLLAAYPGRQFRMAHIVRHVARGRDVSKVERERVRKGVRRVLEGLEGAGQVTCEKPEKPGAYCAYVWKSGT